MDNLLSSLTGNNKEYSAGNIQPEPNGAPEKEVNLNEVVHNNLVARRQKIEDLQAIIRYDALPVIKGDALMVSKTFSMILNSILDHPPAGTKLFIYIKCEKEKSEIMDLSLGKDFQYFALSIFTNITTDAHWHQAQQQHVEDIKTAIHQLFGSFNCHAITNTGCLYHMVLPGKLQ
jgi:hypothetical protein